jgi:non-canonical (house-cleaning) NTP pyrophosphatase
MEVPKKIMKLIDKTGELGYATDAYFKQKDTKQGEGFFGLMTRGRINRAEGYAAGLISALSRFVHKNLY